MLLGGRLIPLVSRESLGEPRFLPPYGIEVVATIDANANRIGKARSDHDLVARGVVELKKSLIEENIPTFGVQQNESFRHNVEGFEQSHMRLLNLLGHQPERTVRPATISIRLVIGCHDEVGQRVEIDLAGFPRRLRELPLKELSHDNYAAASVIVVIVMVWL